MSKNIFINGITELMILSLLEKQDRYIYEIVKAVDEYSDGLIWISQNTIYTSAYKLENEGYISQYTKLVGKRRTRIYYHLEQKGIDYLEELSFLYQRNTEGITKFFKRIDEE